MSCSCSSPERAGDFDLEFKAENPGGEIQTDSCLQPRLIASDRRPVPGVRFSARTMRQAVSAVEHLITLPLSGASGPCASRRFLSAKLPAAPFLLKFTGLVSISRERFVWIFPQARFHGPTVRVVLPYQTPLKSGAIFFHRQQRNAPIEIQNNGCDLVAA